MTDPRDAERSHRLDEILPRRGTGSVKWEYAEGAAARGSSLAAVAPGSDVIPMWVADMDFPCPPAAADAVRERLRHPIFGYTAERPGFAAAWCAWMETRHGFRPRPEWVVPTEGIVPDLGMLAGTLAEGAGVILHPPVYHPFFGIVRHAGASVVSCPLRRTGKPGNPYRLDLERFERVAADPANRVTFLCSPHNPVGRVWRREELTAFAEIASRHRVIVIADEIHGDLMLHGARFTPWLSVPGVDRSRTITASAPSKTFNLAGLKCSCLVIPDAGVRRRVRRARDRRGAYGVNPLSAAAAEGAWRGGAAWLDEVLGYISENARRLQQFFEERPRLGVLVMPPEGTYLAWLDFRESGVPPAELDSFLLGQARVRLEDGRIFGEGGEGFARMNLACPRPLLEEALHRIEQALTVERRSHMDRRSPERHF